eukprot:2740728-Heterocapsa_arctica.AAC.1
MAQDLCHQSMFIVGVPCALAPYLQQHWGEALQLCTLSLKFGDVLVRELVRVLWVDVGEGRQAQ